ncbi:hypothetical protein A3K79_01715 [Candidatus Bathyarchaeota archaeon RBG_13_46_16b]|nr:MAG: hypothetical protein A3K79_01715 [Candidatus Bathyarchaeota archaeon RBG_13_46_16b]
MFFLALLISLLTSLTNRLLNNPEKSKAWRKEIAEWNSELRQAKKANDKKTVEKLMKKQKQILQLQSKMTMQSMKVTMIFFVPLILIWQFLSATFTATEGIAYFPGIGPTLPIPLFNTSVIWWYLLCSMLFGTIFSHVLGITEVAE